MENDENRYSYLIGIRGNTPDITSDKEFKYHLDMFLEIDRKVLLDDIKWYEVFRNPIHPLDPLTEKECNEITGINVSSYSSEYTAMKLRARFNPGTTIHLFHSKFKMDIKDFEILIEYGDKKLIKESRIY